VIGHSAFPAEPWHVRERGFRRSRLGPSETLFTVSNGYLGLRGTLDELRPVYQSGTYVNGFYEQHPIVYAESAYGFDKVDQTMIPVTDGKVIRLYVAGEPLDITGGELVRHERVLDLRAGTVSRELEWVSPGGRRVIVRSRRLASFASPHVACIEWSVEAPERPCELVVVSELTTEEHHAVVKGDPRVAPTTRESVYEHVLEGADDLRLVLGRRTRRSQLLVVAGVDHRLDDASVAACTTDTTLDAGGGRVTFTIDARPGRPWTMTKYLAYRDGARRPADAVRDQVRADLDRAARDSFATHARAQARRLRRLWDRCDIVIEGDDALQQAVRFSLFQVLQASARADGRGIPAKGLTGPGYEGQTFWDMDAYVLSMLSFTAPDLARHALEYRYRMLGHARRRARELGHPGAMFPWRTVTGESGSAYFPAGTAAYHINADVAYALQRYVGATDDREFLYAKGAEMLVETARLWFDLGFFSERAGGQFRIHGVTGPDEYTAMVHDNTYTNLMACANFEFAADTLAAMRRDEPDRYRRLVDRVGLDEREPRDWRRAAKRMYVTYDDELQIHGQDHSFLELQPWDFAGTPADRYPLLLHYHPLEIYRHKVVKQADLVLATFFQGHRFTAEEKRRNFDFYNPLTTGDSSLSPSIQAIMAIEVGHLDVGLEYARASALMDLHDVNHNVRDGVHVAAMAGAWMAMVHGFGGLRERDGVVSFAPCLPESWQRLCFRVVVRDRLLEVDVTPDATTYRLLEGDELDLRHRGKRVKVRADKPAALPMG
jgi:alpha,alpha-trehalose phosphorylase